MAEEAVRPAVGAGDIPIKLLDAQGVPEDLILKPSYYASRVISAQAGGLMGAMERIVRLEMDTAVQVVMLGLYGPNQANAPKDLPERVWATGLSDEEGGVAERCIAYIRVLMNGGRRPRSTSENEGKK